MGKSFKRQAEFKFLEIAGGKFSELYEFVPEQSDNLQSPNPCVREFGPAPVVKTLGIDRDGNGIVREQHFYCGDCKHLQRNVARQQAKIGRKSTTFPLPLHVCPFRVETIMPRICHELDWPACAKFEEKK